MRTTYSLLYKGVSVQGGSPWTETNQTETPRQKPLVQKPPRQRPPGQRPSWTEIPRQRSPPCGQTDACENITLPQTLFAGGNNCSHTAILGSFLRVTHCKLHMDGTLHVHHTINGKPLTTNS